jgi:hypothetical protein
MGSKDGMSSESDKELKPINPKRILRAVVESAQDGLPMELRFTIHVLHLYSNSYITAEALEEGYLKFHGTVSHGQLMQCLDRSRATVKRYLNELHERRILTWKRCQYGIAYQVFLGTAQKHWLRQDIQNLDVHKDVKRCGDCTWEKGTGKRTVWCVDCFEEATTDHIESPTDLQQQFGEECLDCGCMLRDTEHELCCDCISAEAVGVAAGSQL